MSSSFRYASSGPFNGDTEDGEEEDEEAEEERCRIPRGKDRLTWLIENRTIAAFNLRQYYLSYFIFILLRACAGYLIHSFETRATFIIIIFNYYHHVLILFFFVCPQLRTISRRRSACMGSSRTLAPQRAVLP